MSRATIHGLALLPAFFYLWGGSAPPNPPLLVGGKPPKPPKVKDWIHHTYWQARKIVLVDPCIVALVIVALDTSYFITEL